MEKELLIEKIKRYSIGYEHGNWYVVKYYYWERERIPDEYVKEEWFQMEVICKNPLMMRYFGDTVLRKIWETLVDYSRGDELYYTRIVNAIEYILRHEKEDGAEKNIGRLIDAGIIKVLCDKGNKVVKQYVSDNPQISDRVEIMGSIVYAIESVEKGNPAAFKQLCDYARKQ